MKKIEKLGLLILIIILCIISLIIKSPINKNEFVRINKYNYQDRVNDYLVNKSILQDIIIHDLIYNNIIDTNILKEVGEYYQLPIDKNLICGYKSNISNYLKKSYDNMIYAAYFIDCRNKEDSLKIINSLSFKTYFKNGNIKRGQ